MIRLSRTLTTLNKGWAVYRYLVEILYSFLYRGTVLQTFAYRNIEILGQLNNLRATPIILSTWPAEVVL